MRLTKLGHACVRLERDGEVLVIDPGTLTEPEALKGAHAALITHEHPDHLDVARLRSAIENDPEFQIWTNSSVADHLSGLEGHVHTVEDGDTFSVAGFQIGVLGEHHAVIHPDLPVIANIGFFIDGAIFHPGDAFTVPEAPVGTLLLPTNAPWLKVAEMIDYVREVRPAHAYSVHDGLLNEHGLELVDAALSARARELDADARRLKPGQTVDLA